MGVMKLIFVMLVLFANLVQSLQTEQSSNGDTKSITSYCNGEKHSCAVFNSKQMKCLGLSPAFGVSTEAYDILGNTYYELGNNLPYINVTTSASIDKVSCGANHVCVKLDSNDMKCIGYNNHGQTGIGKKIYIVGEYSGYIGEDLPAVNLGKKLQALDIALGDSFSCVIVTGGKVKCFGRNDFGQLGYGDTINRGKSTSQMGDKLPFVKLGNNVEVVSVISAPSAYHTCAILSKPTVSAQRFKCWGRGNSYQLGYGITKTRGDDSREMGDALPLVDLGTESRVKQLALGRLTTCALLVTDTLKCWGYGFFGQLGSGSTAAISDMGNSLPSVLIDSGKTVKIVSVGELHTCIVYDDMISMKCFGYNRYRQLGQGDTVDRGDSPTTMIPSIPNIDLGTGSLKIASIHSSDYFNCVVFENSNVKCFGLNWYGTLGTGNENADGSQLFISLKPTLSPVLHPTPEPSSSPTRDCSFTNKDTCEDVKMCGWKMINGNGKCVEFDCGNFLSKDSCIKNRKCKWTQSECKFIFN